MTKDGPVFIYAMAPAQKSSFKNFFETGPVKNLLEKPGNLRPNGWDLTTPGEARIVKGEYFEAKAAERKLLRLYEDGSFIVTASAADDLLSWGQNSQKFKNFPRLNSLAVIEFTYNFVRLCSELAKYLSPVPAEIMLRVAVRNAFFDDSKLQLVPYSVASEAFMFGYDNKEAPEASMQREINVTFEYLTHSTEAAAFLLVQKIYSWFGLTSEKIPYVSVKDEIRVIDENLIKTAR